ncbi:MAG: hypothetical protein ABFD75_00955 [Smithella sp.]
MENSQYLIEKGFVETASEPVDDESKSKFMAEYLDLIGKVAELFNNREWWSSNMASKNRFTSQLALLLHQFMRAVNALKRDDFDHMIFLSPPWPIVNSLEIFIGHSSAHLVSRGNRFAQLKRLASAKSKAFGSLCFNVIKTSWRSFTVRRKLVISSISDLFISEAPTYVIKSFVYDHSFSTDSTYRDAFFGSLPEFLKKHKKVVILAVILGRFNYCIDKIKECSTTSVIPIECFLKQRDLLSAAWRLLNVKFRLCEKITFFGYNVTDLLNNLLLHPLNEIQFYHYIHYEATKNLLETVRAKTFLFTYENNPWEKMCMMAIRKFSPDTKIIGYQHTVVPQASANMFPGLREKAIQPMPDNILTVGAEPKRIMETYGNYDDDTIEAACGLRFEYLFDTKPAKRQRSGQILIALEGIFEVYKMVNYALRELANLPDYKVKIRTHPVLPIKAFQHQLTHDLNKVTNFSISKGTSLKDDIENSDIIIYWGTTVSLEALSMGKPVIHYDNGSIFSYDPLFKCSHFKWTVSENVSLRHVIDEIYSLEDSEFYARQEKAKSYLNEYFYPINEGSLAKFTGRNDKNINKG